MYQVLLVDDEILIREAIENNIHWEECGFQLAGTAENGKEAIKMLEEKKIDVLLTDICMPYVDGLALSKHVHEHYPDVKILIISGYDEFDYAKQAMKYKVLDYILKPITAAELTEILNKVFALLEKEKQSQQNMEEVKRAYEKNQVLVKERFLQQLLQGSYLKEDIEERAKALNLPLVGGFFQTVVLEIRDSRKFIETHSLERKDLLPFAVANIANEIIQDSRQKIVFVDKMDKATLIFSGEDAEGLQTLVEEQCTAIYKAVETFLQVQISIGIGKRVGELERLAHSYDCALEALHDAYIAKADQFLHFYKSIKEKEIKSFGPEEWSNKFLLLVKSGEEESVRKEVEALFIFLKDNFQNKKTTLQQINSVILLLASAIQENVVAEECYQEGKEKLQSLEQYISIDSLEESFKEFLISINRCMLGNKDSYGKRQAVLAMDYIEKNYKNPDISLQTVCSHLNISTSHFSTIFKNHTGETFIESLTKQRMKKAMSLLEETSLKAYEVADEVGYSDSHYFSATFKKYTGYTPTEYAKMRKGNA